MMTATNIHYELADRVQGLAAGGIGAMLLLARRTGLIRDIDHDLHLLKRHLPYHESDHVLNIAFNILAGGKRIEHLELRRNDEVYLDALGAERIPDPTTAGDFCRRFAEADVLTLMDAINETRLRVWAQQPAEFFDRGDPRRRRHPRRHRRRVQAGRRHRLRRHLGLSSPGDLAGQHRRAALPGQSQRQPPLARAGRRRLLDKAIALCRRAGFRRILLRGDTDFTQTKHLDRWDEAGDVRFVFGIDAHPTSRRGPTNSRPRRTASWSDRRGMRSRPRPASSPNGSSREIVRERGFETIHLLEEMVAEFDYRPVACQKSYRVVVLRKRLGIDKGQLRLFEEYRYFFYITNDRDDARPRRSCSRPTTGATRRT